MSNFAVVAVTYFPNQSTIENLYRISHRCDRLVLVDNTPGRAELTFPRLENLTVHRYKENVGLAKALNKGINLAGQLGYDNIFVLDQDSRPRDDFFEQMLMFKSQVSSFVSNCVLYAPNFYDRNSKTYAKFPQLTRFTVKHLKCGNMQSGPCDAATICITSGTLVTYKGFREMSGLRDDYFIDFIDNEYCLRIYKLGYKIAINCEVTLDHAIGHRSMHKFFGIPIKPNNHSPPRRYYISRNGVRTALDYGAKYPSYVFLVFARIIHEVISIVLYEKNKRKKLIAIIYGFYHGLIGRMGKCKLAILAKPGGDQLI